MTNSADNRPLGSLLASAVIFRISPIATMQRHYGAA